MTGASIAEPARPPRSFADRLAGVARAYGGVVGSRTYFPLWLGQLGSSFGDTLHYIALVILVYQLTGQGIAVALLVVAEIIPALVLGPVAGVVIDRFSRKSTLIGADLFRAVLALTLLWPQGAWHAYLVAAGNTFFNPTVQAVIPVLTTEDQRLAANSVSWSTGRLVQILASAVRGRRTVNRVGWHRTGLCTKCGDVHVLGRHDRHVASSRPCRPAWRLVEARLD